jgi:purine-binding chemotaxis protein CheW
MLHIVFRVGDTEYAAPAESVICMESFAGATYVPGAPAFVAGLVQIRQRVVPVVDLRLRFGLPPAERSLAQRVIVVQVDERAVGLLVDVAREVIDIAGDVSRPPPDLIAEQSRGFVRAVAPVKDRLLMLIDLVKVVGRDTPDLDLPDAPTTDDSPVKEMAHEQ